MTSGDIRAARERIGPHVRRTPVLETPSPFDGAPPVSLKLECLQVSGSFKARGAFHNLLTRRPPAAGCATASGGNHGAAVAYAAKKLGVKARVFVPEIATRAKIARIGLTAPKPSSEAAPTRMPRSAATRMSPRAGR